MLTSLDTLLPLVAQATEETTRFRPWYAGAPALVIAMGVFFWLQWRGKNKRRAAAGLPPAPFFESLPALKPGAKGAASSEIAESGYAMFDGKVYEVRSAGVAIAKGTALAVARIERGVPFVSPAK